MFRKEENVIIYHIHSHHEKIIQFLNDLEDKRLKIDQHNEAEFKALLADGILDMHVLSIPYGLRLQKMKGSLLSIQISNRNEFRLTQDMFRNYSLLPLTFYAVLRNDAHLLKILIQAKCPITFIDPFDQTCISIAHHALTLLDRDLSVDLKALLTHEEILKSDYALHLAAAAGDINAINYIIFHSPAAINQLYNGKTALYYAIKYKKIEAIKILLEKQADINVLCTEFKDDKESPISILQAAVKYTNIEIVRTLIKHLQQTNKNYIPIINELVTFALFNQVDMTDANYNSILTCLIQHSSLHKHVIYRMIQSTPCINIQRIDWLPAFFKISNEEQILTVKKIYNGNKILLDQLNVFSAALEELILAKGQHECFKESIDELHKLYLYFVEQIISQDSAHGLSLGIHTKQTPYPMLLEHFTKLTKDLVKADEENITRILTGAQNRYNQIEAKLKKQPMRPALKALIYGVTGALIGLALGLIIGAAITSWGAGWAAIPGAILGMIIGYQTAINLTTSVVSIGIVASAAGFFQAKQDQEIHGKKWDIYRGLERKMSEAQHTISRIRL